MTQSRRADFISILLLLAVNLTFGMFALSDHGESWDEARLYEYGAQSLQAYRSILHPEIPVDFGNDDLRYYGPAYFMAMSILVQGTHTFFPRLPIIDLWHLGNFVSLQVGVLCFYFLVRRFSSAMATLTASALFASQPLIWGHGFINPKDIPFMSFFTASILLGLKMLDELEKRNFELRSLLRNRWFYLAALFLGLTISIRILGLAAAFIVLFYLAFLNAGKVLRLSYVYLGSALFVSFLTWPYLWPSPVANFIQGLYAMLKFQWIGQVLFQGRYFPSGQLPSGYVPQLLAMQVTETALLLFLIGMVVILTRNGFQRYTRVAILAIPWFLAPILYILILGMNLYDNARQLLFLLPGAFLVIAVGLDWLFDRVRQMWAQALLLTAILLPGAAGILAFHPYEYSYYNFLTTSSVQIFRNYETDYWATSFKQAASYLNEHAPEDSLVIAWGPDQLIERYARPDLRVKSFDELAEEDIDYSSQPYYLVLTTRYDMDLKIFPDIQPVYSVEQNGAVYSVVKYVAP